MKQNRFYKQIVLFVSSLLFLISSGILPVAAEDQIPSELIINADTQYQFAMEYFNQSQYFKAIAELERFIYFFPDNDKVDDAWYHIGVAYLNTGRYREAIEPLSQVAEKSIDQNLKTKALFRMSEIFVNLEDHRSAINLLDHVIDTVSNPITKDEAHYRAGWIYLQQNQMEKARQRFGMIDTQNQELFRLQELEKELSREKLFPEKNPRLAGFLSIIPGAGFAYCERYQDALVAFLLNAGLILAAYESFDSGNEALGGIIAFVGTGFYVGNIYGAVSSAHKYNRASHQRFLEHLKSKTQVTISMTPDRQGVMIGFNVEF